MNLSFSKVIIVLLAFAMCFFSCKPDKSSSVSKAVKKASTTSTKAVKEVMTAKAETVSNKSDELLEIYVSQDESAKSDEDAKNAAMESVETKINKARNDRRAEASTPSEAPAPVSTPKVVNSTPKVETMAAEDEEAPLKPTKINFDNKTHEYGIIMQGDKVSHKFNFTNTGSVDLVISDVSASCGCTKPSYPFIPIAPGERGYIGVNFDSKGKLGRQQPHVTVVSNAGTTKLRLEGFVDAERAKPASQNAPKVEIIDESEMEKLKEEAMKSAPKVEEGGQ